MTDFFRFPRTPHLVWLSPGDPRADKLLAPSETEAFLSGDVVVEEKIDGANLGFSVDESGVLRAQNRGSYIDIDEPQGQWKPLKRWLSTRRFGLLDALSPDLILYGEWCYAVHSVRYSRLPDWFLAFDVFDKATHEFWSADRRNELCRTLGVQVVPELGRGRFGLDELKGMLSNSTVTDGPAEGLYVRREEDGLMVERGKIVRAEFVQTIEEHWSKRGIEANRVDPSSAPR